ncbi:MAG TPA: glycosyltransferase family 4 protein [Terriglobia bacterium]|nr:glycosyltransferase family 4 protein [Terriglobia bacterium]
MRIVWIAVDVPYPPNSGGNVCIYSRIRELARRGHRIRLFAFARPDEIAGRTFEPLREICEDVQVYPKRSAKRALLGYPTSSVPMRVLTRPAEALSAAVGEMVRENWAEVIQIETSVLARCLPDPGFEGKAPAFLDFFSLMHEEAERIAAHLPAFSSRRALFRLEAKRARAFEHGALRQDKFYRYQFVSDAELDRVGALFPHLRQKLVHVPIAVDLEAFAAPEGPSVVRCDGHRAASEKNILFCGSFENPANEDAARWFARDILPLVRREVPEVRFVIVGRNARKTVGDLRSAQVEIFSDVEDVRPHLYCADVCVMPLRGGGGVRVKLLEAVAAERTIVTTRLGMEGVCLVPYEHLLVADREEEFARHCVEVLRQPARFQPMAQEARVVLARHHSSEAVGDQLESLYEDARSSVAAARV